jgi:hypothetical protein
MINETTLTSIAENPSQASTSFHRRGRAITMLLDTSFASFASDATNTDALFQ